MIEMDIVGIVAIPKPQNRARVRGWVFLGCGYISVRVIRVTVAPTLTTATVEFASLVSCIAFASEGTTTYGLGRCLGAADSPLFFPLSLTIRKTRPTLLPL